MSLRQQITEARRHIRKLKRAAPYIFPEWQRLKNAERQVEVSRKELEAARKAWRQVGADQD
jgi:hypothetical protein